MCAFLCSHLVKAFGKIQTSGDCWWLVSAFVNILREEEKKHQRNNHCIKRSGKELRKPKNQMY